MDNSLEKIRARQLARLMAKLREINTPKITMEAVERGFNFFYEDALNLFLKTTDKGHAKSSKKHKNF